jgi:chemotaxis protein methyltransferase CheR
MEMSPATFDELRRLIHRISGIVVADDKEYLIRHRLEPLVRRGSCRDFDEFRKKLSSNVDLTLQEAIIEAITTQETAFFRDNHPFETFRQQVLPALLQNARGAKNPSGGARIRLWCAGAATGQEAYSLAMLVCEYLELHRNCGFAQRDFSILATDISGAATATATAGKYERRDIDRGLSPALSQRYFDQESGCWVARPILREMLEFRRLNLTQPFTGLGKFDAIFCRNVLIYFDEPTRRRICEQFIQMLPDGGWLVLGSAENLYGLNTRFESVRFGDTLLFRKPAA